MPTKSFWNGMWLQHACVTLNNFCVLTLSLCLGQFEVNCNIGNEVLYCVFQIFMWNHKEWEFWKGHCTMWKPFAVAFRTNFLRYEEHTGCVKRQFICILYFCCAAAKCENRNIFHVVKLGLWGHANLWWWHNTLLKLEKVFYRLKMGWHIWWTLWTKMHFCEESTPKGKRCKHCRINYIKDAALWCTYYGGIFRFCKG